MTGEPASVVAMRQLAEEAHRRPRGPGTALLRTAAEYAADRRQQRAGHRPADAEDEPPGGR
ncbi:hypothetical protein [Modestobacter sp. SYSU DS0875]